MLNDKPTLIGRGTYSRIYKHTLQNGEISAVKIYHDKINPSILREIHCLHITKKCKHIIDIWGVVEDSDMKIQLFLEYNDMDLHRFIKEIKIEERILYLNDVLKQTLIGLNYLYENNIIHRDIKPSNIIVNYSSGVVPTFNICDFGLSCIFIDKYELRDIDIYTVEYRAPEILAKNNKYSHNADIWALGMTIVEYICGKPLINCIKCQSRSYVLNEIFKLLAYPLRYNTYNITAIKYGNIINHIDVDQVFKNKLSSTHYNLISENHTSVLSEMLSVNMYQRPYVNTLVKSMNLPMMTKPDFIKRGSIKTGSVINTELYYHNIESIIDFAIQNNINSNIIILSIDLLERYLANYCIIDINDIKLIFCICYSISVDMLEESQTYTYYIDTLNGQYTECEFTKMKIQMIKQFDCLLFYDEINVYVSEINHYNYRNTILKDIYSTINNMGKYTGEMLYEEIIDIFNQHISPKYDKINKTI